MALIGLGLILVQFEGVLPKVISFFLFIYGISIAQGPQYWIIETGGVMTEISTKPYPSSILFGLIWIHISLGYFALARFFREDDRNWRGRKIPEPSR